MLTRDQLKALDNLSLWEIEAARAVLQSAFHALEVDNRLTFLRLCQVASGIVGEFDPRQGVVVANQLTIHWVERTPGLRKSRGLEEVEWSFRRRVL